MKVLVCIFVLMAALPGTSARAQATDLAIREVPVPSAIGRVPIAGDGAWRRHVQLVWDPTAKVLTRRSYDIFDPFAGETFDLFWQPRNPTTDQSGQLNGEGILTWRTPGSFRHSDTGVIAQYIGHMVDGQASGFGHFTDAGGLRYTGQWKAGLMHGPGQLINARGDAYTGAFRSGTPHGAGLLVDATGMRHEGSFAAGQPDGPGVRATPDGNAFASIWVAGIETEAAREAMPDFTEKVQSSGAEGLSIALSVGGTTGFCCQLAGSRLGYAALSEPGRLSIFPDDPTLMDQWRGRINVVINDATSFDWQRAVSGQYSFLNYDATLETTLPLRFGLRNASREGVDIVGAFLEVGRSRIDTAPMMQAIVLKPLSPSNTDFSIENYGWATAENTVLTAAFAGPNAATENFVLPLPDVADVGAFSMSPLLRDYGVATDRLDEVATLCAGTFGQNQNPAGCTDRLRQSGLFGDLARFLVENDSATHFGLRMIGTLEYNWRDGDGQMQQTVSPFDGHLPLAALTSRAECEGGDFEVINHGVPFDMELSADNYRINLPVFAEVQAGEERRWEVRLDAEKSSNHDMRIVMLLADGRTVVSRDIGALIFNPRRYDQSIRPFEPRC